ncbi:MAG: cytochrome c biogenesis protein ResB, partial [Chloroflexi bacterium]|nr:cytochrome c biogenesis protein ResB [Chloroflexota bacterium]
KRETFGPLTDAMYRLGFFEVFHARWFLFALGFLVVFVTTCTFNRWSPTFRNVFRPPIRVPDSFYERAHNRTVLAPVSVDGLRVGLRSMRFGRIDVDQRDGAIHVFADRYPWAMLATFVSHMALILFLAGGLVTWATGFTANIFTGEGTTAPVFAVSDPNQLQVRVDDAVGRYGEKGNPLDFRSHLTIFRNGQEVKSGYTTVNDPLEYGGYRFHQAAFFPYGAALRIRATATGNTVFHETFPMEEITAAPVVTISDASGRELLRDAIAPTDFLETASGTLVQAPGGPLLWIGITAIDDDRWQLVAFDPQSGDAGAQLRVDEGASGELSGLTLRLDEVTSLPAAVGVNIPDGSEQTLAQLTTETDGAATLMLVSRGRPAISLAQGEPVTVGAFEYTFEGAREFSGISVKRDSGAWFIWVATAMLVIGLALTFYVPRRRLWIRLTSSGTQIAALAEKSGGFEKDMRTLARRLGVETPPELQEER